MKMGRPRKPTQKHKLLGSYRPDRHGTNEPTPPDGVAECPAWVLGEARDHWACIAPMLEGMGIMSPAYSSGLALLVNSLGRYIEYEKQVSERGPVTITDKGNEIVNPYWAARNKAWDQVWKALNGYGLTPSAVSSITMPDQNREGPEHDDMESFLKLAGTTA